MIYTSKRREELYQCCVSKRASVVLEAAIAAPIFISVIAIILIAVNLVRTEVIFTHAVDQVSNELSLAFPVMDAGAMAIDSSIEAICAFAGESEEENGEAGHMSTLLENAGNVTGIITAVFNHLDINMEDIVSTAIFGEYVKTRIESEFERLGENNIIVDPIEDISVYLDFNKIAHVLNIRVYYKLVSPFGSKEKMIATSAAVYGELFYDILENGDSQKNSKIWDETNFNRGIYFRNEFGANLPFSYPVIAGWNNGTATSIKSVDLTAPTYESDEEIVDKISRHIDELAGFSGTEEPWGQDKISIDESDISSRELIVIIPENTPEDRRCVLEECISVAEEKGIVLIIETFGVSEKYSELQT